MCRQTSCCSSPGAPSSRDLRELSLHHNLFRSSFVKLLLQHALLEHFQRSPSFGLSFGLSLSPGLSAGNLGPPKLDFPGPPCPLQFCIKSATGPPRYGWRRHANGNEVTSFSSPSCGTSLGCFSVSNICHSLTRRCYDQFTCRVAQFGRCTNTEGWFWVQSWKQCPFGPF